MLLLFSEMYENQKKIKLNKQKKKSKSNHHNIIETKILVKQEYTSPVKS